MLRMNLKEVINRFLKIFAILLISISCANLSCCEKDDFRDNNENDYSLKGTEREKTKKGKNYKSSYIEMYSEVLRERLSDWIKNNRKVDPGFSLSSLKKYDRNRTFLSSESKIKKDIINGYYSNAFSPDKKRALYFSFGEDDCSVAWVVDFENEVSINIVDCGSCGPSCIYNQVLWLNKDVFAMVGWFESIKREGWNHFMCPELKICDMKTKETEFYRGKDIKDINIREIIDYFKLERNDSKSEKRVQIFL